MCTAADAARERKLARAGYTVVRLTASRVERSLPRTVEIGRVALVQALGECGLGVRMLTACASSVGFVYTLKHYRQYIRIDMQEASVTLS